MMPFFSGALVLGRAGLITGLAFIGFAIGVFYHASAWACATNTSMGGPAERVFELRIEGGKIAEDARTVRVTEKDTVHLHWFADAPVVVRLQGYDIEKEVEPGAVTAFTFEAHITGRFPIEAIEKDESRVAAHERTPIGYLEVYPR